MKMNMTLMPFIGAKVNAFPLAALGDDVRELQVKGGEELRLFFGRTLWHPCLIGHLRESCEAPSVRWTSPQIEVRIYRKEFCKKIK
jgi:hypothetical protein